MIPQPAIMLESVSYSPPIFHPPCDFRCPALVIKGVLSRVEEENVHCNIKLTAF